MDGDTRAGGPAVSGTQDPDQIREDIENTRQELGDTVEALSAKADVKAQARQKVQETKESLSEKKDEVLGRAREVSPQSAVSAASGAGQKARQNPLPLAAAGAFAAGFLLGRISGRD